jgi:hypothetical protein
MQPAKLCLLFMLLCLQASAQMEKLRVSHKRKLAELQGSLQSKVAETGAKLAKVNSKAGKTQDLGGMLSKLIAAE